MTKQFCFAGICEWPISELGSRTQNKSSDCFCQSLPFSIYAQHVSDEETMKKSAMPVFNIHAILALPMPNLKDRTPMN